MITTLTGCDKDKIVLERREDEFYGNIRCIIVTQIICYLNTDRKIVQLADRFDYT